MRSQPPRTPARLSRLPEYGTLVIPADAGIPASRAIADAAGLLKKRGYRVDVRDRDGARPSVGAERGFLREVGNLVFHTSLIGVLVSVAIGGLFGYSGQRILGEGDTFVNTLVGYDQFTPGTNFQSSQLQPYSVQLDKFQITFDRESRGKVGQPIDFKADVTTKETPDAPAKKEVLKVNDPLTLGGTSMYLTGNGYAPVTGWWGSTPGPRTTSASRSTSTSCSPGCAPCCAGTRTTPTGSRSRVGRWTPRPGRCISTTARRCRSRSGRRC